jgi:dihydrofolate reductase
MSKLVVRCFSLSLDGYGAGPDQSLDNPHGVNGPLLAEWMLATRTFQRMYGRDSGETGVDDDFVARSFENIGAWIMGRNMFGPIRGHWPDAAWKGWWGDNPPYHVPVFVLTNHARPPLAMEGDTTFHFVTEGIDSALRQATAAANGKDIRLGGGASTIQQYLRARLVDEMHLAVSPVLLGAGESLFAGLDLRALGYACTEHISTARTTHLIVTRTG